MGVKPLRRIQLGVESVAGTPVAATALWLGEGVIQDDLELVEHPYDTGYLSGIDRTYIQKYGGSLAMLPAPVSFEQFCYILESGVAATTGVVDGAGSGYVRTYTFPTTVKNTTRTYTIEGGDDTQAEEMDYGYVESFNLEGRGGATWMLGAQWRARQVTNTTFTGAIVAPTVSSAQFGLSKLYIDAIGGTVGTTQVTNTLLGATLNVTTGLVPKYTADGSLDFSFNEQVGPMVELSVTMEHNGSAVTEKGHWRDETPRLIQLLIEGPDLGTAGTAYTKKTIKINLAGKWTRFEALGDENGNDTLTGTFRARYDPTAATFASIVVVNELSALP